MSETIYTLTDYQLANLLSAFSSCRIHRVFFTENGKFGITYEKWNKVSTEYIPKERSNEELVICDLKAYTGLEVRESSDMPKQVRALSKGIKEIPMSFSKEEVDKMMENVFKASRETVHDVIFDTIHGKQPLPKYRSFEDYKAQVNK